MSPQVSGEADAAEMAPLTILPRWKNVLSRIRAALLEPPIVPSFSACRLVGVMHPDNLILRNRTHLLRYEKPRGARPR